MYFRSFWHQKKGFYLEMKLIRLVVRIRNGSVETWSLLKSVKGPFFAAELEIDYGGRTIL